MINLKVGIITFHWGTNHGAVLQAYATKEYLTSKGHTVNVIDYFPKRSELKFSALFRPHYPSVMLNRIPKFFKEKRLSPFRKNLNLTNRYYTNQELIDNPPDFDLLLAGSDQVWNPSYALYGERKPTPVYFLNFGKESSKKAALSVSFGCTKYPEKAKELVLPLISQLDAISVRENSGIEILEEMGITNAVVTADPTSLLSREDYLKLCEEIPKHNENYTALCILRKQNKETKNTIKSTIQYCKNKVIAIQNKSMEEWLGNIRDANTVVTNSFHCVMMCLKLHTPFFVITETGSFAGMNDRLFTLLGKFGLTNRIIDNPSKLPSVNEEIDWIKIDELMEEYASSLKNYLSSLF